VGQKYFFQSFFFLYSWAISFFGEIIYFSALDLKPASLNLRPALWCGVVQVQWRGVVPNRCG
jgi:hypothetical protein